MDAYVDKLSLAEEKRLEFYSKNSQANTLSLKATYLIKISKNKQSPYAELMLQHALALLTKAIEVGREEHSTQIELYYTQRSDLYQRMGLTEEAKDDVLNAFEWIKENPEKREEIFGEIYKSKAKRAYQSLYNLNKASAEIAEMEISGEISPKQAKVLNTFGEYLKDHTAELHIVTERVDVHDERLKENEKGIEELRVIVQELRNRKPNLGLENKLEEIFKKCEDAGFIKKEEIEGSALTTILEIKGNVQLREYYDSLYNTLSLDNLEAGLVGSERLKRDDITVGGKIVTGMIGFLGGRLASAGAESLVGTSKANEMKKKAIKLAQLVPNPSERVTLCKLVAEQCTLKKSEDIKRVQMDSYEIRHWLDPKVHKKVKNIVIFNAQKKLCKNPQQILGCIDGLKIIKYIRSGELSLLRVPTSHSICTKLVAVAKAKPEKELHSSGKILYNFLEGYQHCATSQN